MTQTYDLPEPHVLVIGHTEHTVPLLDQAIHGPFESAEQAQEYARWWREKHGVPGHANRVPTAEENEAWTWAGYTFAIFQPTREDSHGA